MSDRPKPLTDETTDAEFLLALLWAFERAHRHDAPGIRGQTLNASNPMIVRMQCSAGFLGACSDRLRRLIDATHSETKGGGGCVRIN